MTLIETIQLFTDLGNAHQFIKTTMFGQSITTIGSTDEKIKYPAFFAKVTDSNIQLTVIERTYELTICDLVLPDKSNLYKVLSDTEQTLNELIEFLKQESNDFTLIGEPILATIDNMFGDAVTGWTCQILLQTTNTASTYCGLPIDGFMMTGTQICDIQRDNGFKCSDLLNCTTFTDLQQSVITIEGDIVTINETLIFLQDEIDNISFALPLNEIGVGTGTSIGSSSNFTFDPTLFYVDTVVTQLISLSGSGSQMVVADNNGVLSKQAIPSSATLMETYIGFGDASDLLTGSSDLTWNGSNLFVNGTLQIDSQSGTGDRIVESTSAGLQSATKQMLPALITDAGTITLITNTSNWDLIGVYIGTALTVTYQGQYYYDTLYYYFMIADNVPLRMARV